MKRYRDKISRSGAWCGMLSAVAVVLLSLLAFVSCTDEQMLGGGSGSSMESGGNKLKVQISVPQSGVTRSTEQGSTLESRLDSVMILVFKKAADPKNALLEVALTVDLTKPNASQPLWGGTDSTLIVELKEPLGAKIIYAIANWDTTGLAVGAYSVADLNKETTTIASADNLKAPFPMLMSSDSIVANDLSALSYKVSANLVRQQSKFRAKLTLTHDVQTKDTSIVWQRDSMKIWVNNVPTQAFVVEKNSTPSHSSSLNSDKFDVKLTSSNAPDWEWKTKSDIYINQNTMNDLSDVTFIVVQLPYKNKYTQYLEVDNYYKLYFNTKLSSTITEMSIRRNTLYDFNINILGRGLPINGLVENVNITNDLTILPWENVVLGDVEDLPQKYFKIDRTKCTFDLIPGSKSEVNIQSDVEDWKLIADWEGNGIKDSILFAPTKGVENKVLVFNGIHYTFSSNSSTAKITIKKDTAATKTDRPTLYFKAQNLKVPLTIDFDNGFIPVDELPGEWKEDLDGIPLKGIQIAKMGNVRPSGVASSADNRVWFGRSFSVDSDNDKIYAKEWIGYGLAMSNFMRNNSGYEAIMKCVALDSKDEKGWYMNSLDELRFIHDLHRNNSTRQYLGPSYVYQSLNYQTTSYVSSHVVAGFNVITGVRFDVNANYNGFPFPNVPPPFRCVRNIY